MNSLAFRPRCRHHRRHRSRSTRPLLAALPVAWVSVAMAALPIVRAAHQVAREAKR